MFGGFVLFLVVDELDVAEEFSEVEILLFVFGLLQFGMDAVYDAGELLHLLLVVGCEVFSFLHFRLWLAHEVTAPNIGVHFSEVNGSRVKLVARA